MISRRGRWVVGIAAGLLIVAAGLVVVGGPVREALNYNRACQSIEKYLAAEGQQQSVGDGPRIVRVLGDSYVTGDALPDRSDRWVNELARDLNATVTFDGIGFTGYVNGGCDEQPFASRVSGVSGPSDAVIVAGGLNDVDASPEDLKSAVAHTLDAIDAGAPIYVLGPATTPARGDVSWIDEILKDAATQRGMAYIQASGWNLAFLDDGTHMTSAGHATYAAEVEAALAD